MSLLNIPNQSRTSYRLAVNTALQSLAVDHADAIAPDPTYAYMMWADTSGSPTVIVKQRNAANAAWVNVGVLDASGHRPYYNGASLGDAATKTVGSSSGQVALLGAGGVFPASYLPTSASEVPTGAIMDFFGATAPSGWYLLDGSTIGPAASLAIFADDNLEALFLHIWSNSTNTWNAVSGGRGASNAADWAANKTIQLPDARGCTTIALDNLGGTAASRVTLLSTSGANSTINGARGGAQTHKLANNETPAHTHTVPLVQTSGAGSSGIDAIHVTSRNAAVPETTSSFGGGSAHSNTQPWVALGKIIKA